MAGKVYLVGAGPGDPGLLTRAAEAVLRRADLVLYDALVHPELLELCTGETVFVGKRAGQPSARQERINARLVAEARAGKIVARLKGGDPYLFGRGSEEAEVLSREGVPFEVVPGVPSPLAATAYAGISLTHRAMSSSVAYLTATESPEKDQTSHDWAKLATATQTLVIFMGMRKIRSLMDLLVANGRDPNTPAAVIARASLPTQQTVVGTVATLADLAEATEIGMPSLLVVGEVVTLRESLRWFDTQPLFGTKVLVTRPVHQAGSMAALLRDRGAQPLMAPTIELSARTDELDLLSTKLSGYDWVVFTSANTVDFVLDAVDRTGGDARRFGTARLIAIGDKTAAAMRLRGLRADEVATTSRAEGVVDALEPLLAEKSRVLIPRSGRARNVLVDRLVAGGHHVDAPAADDLSLSPL